MVAEAPFTDCDTVMLLVPMITARTCPPDATPDVPNVFPRFDAPIDCDSTVCEFTENWYWFPVVERIVMPPPSSLKETVPDV